jgi:3-oxo-5-alpha-steroid 4-dehydrogenase 3 / polyprenol reductase
MFQLGDHAVTFGHEGILSWFVTVPFRPDIIIIVVRCFYLLSAACILLVRCVPPLRNRFLEYGPRSIESDKGRNQSVSDASTSLTRVLDYVASWRVSHSYFLLFYLASTSLSAYWIYNTYSTEPLLKVRSIGPIYALVLFALHSLRRLFECMFIVVPNPRSTIWIGHFAIGLAFYLFIHVAIIAEYASDDGPAFTRLTPRVIISTVIFTFASVWQHKYHEYLSGLVKYSLPDRFGATHIVAPHYTAECLLYASLAVLTAKDDQFLNRTLLCVLVFVVVNLGVTADGTKKWQLSKFPERKDAVQRRWRMLPGLF